MRSICFIVLLLTTAILCERINIPLENKAPIRGHVTLEHESFESDDPSIVQTAAGTVRGLVKDTHREFLGIMFAAPPTGQDRWAPPRPRSPWNGVFNATKFGAGCPQDCSLPPHTCPETISEDCLSLNVYTPRGNITNAPVMLYLPGGRFEQGTAGTLLYNGFRITNESNIILVVTNYRLGALGYLCANDDTLKTCNAGFLDQQMAMKWVKQNIAAFGGNPNMITLAGQSAGATSVASHLMSDSSSALFERAIMMSNPIGIPIKNVIEAQDYATKFYKDIGCTTNECLLSKSWQEVVQAQTKDGNALDWKNLIQTFLPETPVVDGELIKENPLQGWAKRAKKPLLTGTVREEARMFIWEAFGKEMSRIELDAVAVAFWGFDAYKVLEEYPETSAGKNDSRNDLSPMGTDYLFLCPLRKALKEQDGQGMPPSYRYMFDHVIWPGAWGSGYPECFTHVCHAAGLPYLYQTGSLNGFRYSDDEMILSQEMLKFFSNFVISGNPNEPHNVDVEMPQYDSSKDNILHMKADNQGSVVLNGYRKVQCDLWDEVGYKKDHDK